MKIRANKGFTLIELLVVIAIIGILSGIVLTSLNSARDKAKDASAKTSLASMKAQAEIIYDDNAQSYDTVCADSATLIAAIDKQINPNTAVCTDAVTSWATTAQLSNGDFWCADSSGFSGKATSATLSLGGLCVPAV